MALNKKIVIYMYGLVCAIIMGILLGLFYLLQGWLIKTIWPGETFRPLFNGVLIVLIGFVIFVTQKTVGDMPKKMSTIRLEVFNTGTAAYRFLPLQLLIPPIILSSGTSLGPEATLVSSTVLFGIWLSDKIRYLKANWRVSTRQKLRIMMTPHHYLLSRHKNDQLVSWWTPGNISYLILGIAGFYLTCKLGGERSVIVYLGQSNWQPRDLIWLGPIILVALLLGKVCLKLMTLLREVILLRFTATYSLVIFGALSIYLATLFDPAINFSGMLNFHLLATSWQNQSILFLLLNSALKLGLLTICLNTGWLGGEIFPVLFCATAQGIALSQMFPQVDAIFLIGIFAIVEGAVILESPLIAGGVMMIMFLPPNLLILNLGLTIILFIARKYYAPKYKWVRFLLP